MIASGAVGGCEHECRGQQARERHCSTWAKMLRFSKQHTAPTEGWQCVQTERFCRLGHR